MADNKRTRVERSRDQPSKYADPKIQKIILDALADGNYLYVAAQLAGVAPDTLHSWIKRGRRAIKGEQEEPEVLVDFVERIELTLAKWEAETVKQVHTVAKSGAPNTWQAAMTMLERKAPDRWGRRDKVEVEADTPLIQLNQLVLADESVRQQSRELLRRVTSLGTERREIEAEGVEDE